MFGFSLSELVVVVLVTIFVVGPKDLPKMLRKLGQYAGKLRRMASDLRAQSGIDDALRSEGLADDIAEIRKLARGELDAVHRAAVVESSAATFADTFAAETLAGGAYSDDFYVVRDREYPRDGADSYGALPDNAIVYVDGLPKTKFATDPLYVLGDPLGVVPLPTANESIEALPDADANSGTAANAEPDTANADQGKTTAMPASPTASAPITEAISRGASSASGGASE